MRTVKRIPLSIVTLDGDKTDGVLVGVLASDLDAQEARLDDVIGTASRQQRLLLAVIESVEANCQLDHLVGRIKAEVGANG